MPRSKLATIMMKKKRMIFAAMEPYFNLAFEAFLLQTNGTRPMPTVTELAALYFDVDEITAAKYLLGSAKGGVDCELDSQICSTDTLFPSPLLKLKDCPENEEWRRVLI